MDPSKRLLNLKEGLSKIPRELIEQLQYAGMTDLDVAVCEENQTEIHIFNIHIDFYQHGRYKLFVNSVPKMKDEEFRLECIAFLYGEEIYNSIID